MTGILFRRGITNNKPLDILKNEGDVSKLTRTQSGGIETTDGTLYVSKPFRSSKGKKSKAVLSFVPRNSVFDPQDTRQPNEFRVRLSD